MSDVYIYLRKSRADLEAEQRGEGETLLKHKKQLLALARERDYAVKHIFEEIVSGETIIHRPEMLKLLQNVEQNKCDGVLVMDIDRLGRGNMQDQGLIMETFKASNTLIITPRKTYDLNDEFDEEYSEFEAFMARKELKMTTRRMQRGRINSINEGNYLAPRPPYGYDIVKDSTGRYLVENKEQAEIVRLIFSMYADDAKSNGSRIIAQHLNDMGVLSYTNKQWSASMIVSIIKNPVYSGKITWKKKKSKKSADPNKVREVKLNPRDEWIVVDGKHKAIVDDVTFRIATEKMNGRYHLPFKHLNPVSNQFAGLVVCGHCGKNMIRRPMGESAVRIICGNRPDLCDCKSSKFDDLEKKIIDVLEQQLNFYESDLANEKHDKTAHKQVADVAEAQLAAITVEINEYNKQKDNLHNLLERGVYDIETFLERSTIISEQLALLHEQKGKIEKQLLFASCEDNVSEIMYPLLKSVLISYKLSHSAEEQNNLLRSVVDHIIYKKTQDQKLDDFSIEAYMLSPQTLLSR